MHLLCACIGVIMMMLLQSGRALVVSRRVGTTFLHTLSRRYFPSSSKSFSSSIQIPLSDAKTPVYVEDDLLTGLSDNQDIMVRVISLQQVMQTYLDRIPCSDLAAQTLGEVAACTLLMGSSMKGEETLQVNIVGTGGLHNITVISDAQLQLRGRVGDSSFAALTSNSLLQLMGGEGQIQVVKNHPTFKNPMTGITALRDASVSFNLALYLAESEQRTAALLADVKVVQGRCDHAIGVLVERLPGCTDEKVELAIHNLEMVQQKTLASYLTSEPPATANDAFSVSSSESALDRIMNDCLLSMVDDSIRWNKKPTFKCNCSRDRVLGALKVLPVTDRSEMIRENKPIEMKCEFCGEKYDVSIDEIKNM